MDTILDTITACTGHDEVLNREAFQFAKLRNLPEEYKIYSFTDRALLFSVGNGCPMYATIDRSSSLVSLSRA